MRCRTQGEGIRATGERNPKRRNARLPAWLAPQIWLAVLAFVALASCERTPSKSDYVSAQVTELCKGQVGEDLRACRLAVIKQFMDTPLEEMQRRFPAPEPRARPSCGT